MSVPDSLDRKLETLKGFSACDISDALLKLEKPNAEQPARAGYLADIVPFVFPRSADTSDQPIIVGKATTLMLIGKHADAPDLPDNTRNTIPKGSHWVDLTESGTIVVIDQPPGQTCAAIGGIMAAKMKLNGVKACVVGGRIRDIAELKKTELPIFAIGRSTVGTGAESKVYARDISVNINGVIISPGDIVFCDPVEGVVVIPQDLLDDVLGLMPKLVAADDKVKASVSDGMNVAEAFKKFRS